MPRRVTVGAPARTVAHAPGKRAPAPSRPRRGGASPPHLVCLVFDTETTGLIENMSVRLDRQPEVIEFAGILADLDTGEVLEEKEVLIRPSLGRIDAKIEKITGIDDSMVRDAPAFPAVAADLRALILRSPVVLAHNASFDVDMMTIEFQRLGEEELVWPRAICTVEQSAHYRGNRMSLGDLHLYLFGERHADAHRAMPDVRALFRIAIEMRKRGDL